MRIESEILGKCTFRDSIKRKNNQTEASLTIMVDGGITFRGIGFHIDFGVFAGLSPQEQDFHIVEQTDVDGDDKRIIKIGKKGRILGIRFEEEGTPIDLNGLPISNRRLKLARELLLNSELCKVQTTSS